MTDHDELRRQAAAAAGLPEGLASRLRGDTPEDLAADARRLAALLPPPPPPRTHDELLVRLLGDNREKHRNLIDAMHTDPDGETPR